MTAFGSRHYRFTWWDRLRLILWGIGLLVGVTEAALVVLIAHEVGHTVAAYLLGFRIRRVGLGFASFSYAWDWGDVAPGLHGGTWSPHVGIAPEAVGTFSMRLIALGGPLGGVAVSCLLYLMGFIDPWSINSALTGASSKSLEVSAIWELFFRWGFSWGVCVIAGVTSILVLLPFWANGNPSDGMIALGGRRTTERLRSLAATHGWV